MKDIQASARLKAIYEKVVAALRETMRPELRFMNELLSAPTEDEARTLELKVAESADLCAASGASVTVIATGFGGRPRRRRAEAPVAQVASGEAPAPPRERPQEPSDSELEIPSFLRED